MRRAPNTGASFLPPAIQELSAVGFVVSIGDTLDAAAPLAPPGMDAWRAYAAPVYATLEEARANVAVRVEELTRGWSDAHSFGEASPIELHIHHVLVDGFRGRDYCSGGCLIPDAAEQLRFGGHEHPAWREIQRQRERDEVEGTKLLGSRGEEVLFVYADTPALHPVELVETVRWPS